MAPRIRLAAALCLLLVALVALQQCAAAPVKSVVKCPNGCSNSGICETSGVCTCHPGFSGADCSTVCPNLCSGQGSCAPDGKCICTPGFAGVDCATAAGCPRSGTDHPELECAGHGVCDRPTQQCICRQGYVGKDCSIDDGSCGSHHCSNRGHCSNGQCQCDLGFSGEHCEEKAECPSRCAGNGICIGGTCHCYPGFSGNDCKTKDAALCPGKDGGCSGSGVCSNGACVCSIGFAGKACELIADVDSQPFCAGGNNCSKNGVCRNNQCFCRPGFYGPKCEHEGCAHGCGEHGFCSVGICRCQPGWGGGDCATKSACPNGCSNHGVCDKGVCSCEPYYAGKDCGKITLPPLECPTTNGRDCSGNGLCFLGQCFCEGSFSGTDCATTVQNCPKNCGGSSRGTCRFGSCFCEPGYEGPSCETKIKCAAACSKHGICIKGECKCALGFKGKDCTKRVSPVARQAALERDLLSSVIAQAEAPRHSVPRTKCGWSGKPCSEHGMCIGGACVCEPGFGGQDCALILHGSPSADCGAKGCANNGECVFGTCVCLPGFGGRHCQKTSFLPCPNDCSQHGLCYLGACECHPGFKGDDCSRVKSCKNVGGCQRGACVQGVCECVFGWRGANCSEEIPAAEMPTKDYLSPAGLNTCGTGGCGTHGVCISHQCVCVEGFVGRACEMPMLNYVTRPTTEATPANPAVSDIFGTAPCDYNCGLHGVCVGAQCSCIDGWAGDNCMVIVPVVQAHTVYGTESDYLSIMTAEKRARVANIAVAPITTVLPTTTTTATTTAASTTTTASLMESHSHTTVEAEEAEEVPVAPQLHRHTAIVAASPVKKAAYKYSPDAQQTDGADAAVLASSKAQVDMSQMVVSSSSSYTMAMNPFLMTFLCFITGVLITISLKCLLDKREQEKRKMKKMEELLQPAT